MAELRERPATTVTRRRSIPGRRGVDLPVRLLGRARRAAVLLGCSSAARRHLGMRAAAAALAIVLAAWVAGQSTRARAALERWGATTVVMRTLEAMPAGTVLEPGRAEAVRVPVSLAPSDPLHSLGAGARLTRAVGAGELLSSTHLHRPAAGSAPRGTLAIRLDPAVPVPDLQAGDRVEVMGAAVPGAQPRTVAHAAVVLAPPSAEDPTVEVAVPRGDAPSVTEAALTGGLVLLRSPD